MRPEVAACFGSPDVNRFQDASCMFVVRRVSRLGFKCEEAPLSGRRNGRSFAPRPRGQAAPARWSE